MIYKLEPAEQADSGLFFRLGEETSERYGAVGYLRADFGKTDNKFWTTWLDCEKSLKTGPFKSEFSSVIDCLRKEGSQPPFANRASLSAFCAATSGLKLSAARGDGYKIQTEDYSYFVRCLPSYVDYDIGLYAYDNRYLIPELAGEHDIPRGCYSLLPSTGEIILIRRGQSNAAPIAFQCDNRKLSRMFVDDKNREYGTTRAQEEAMLAGSLFGWDKPAARPWNYDQNGQLIVKPKEKGRESR